MKRRFNKFLGKHKMYHTYYNQTEGDMYYVFNDMEPEHWIESAFIWAGSKEGQNVWSDLSDMWKESI